MPQLGDAISSREILRALRDTLAEEHVGQDRLNRIVQLISFSLSADVCSIYLLRDAQTMELCATKGLNPEAVHQTRLRVGQGLVGFIAETTEPISLTDAPSHKKFRYMPETGEEIYSSFCGVPIQRLGNVLGVLVVQNKEARNYNDDEIHALEMVAMVLAEMAELGAFVSPESHILAPHKLPFPVRAIVAQEGIAIGHVLLHEPQVVVANPVADNPEIEFERLDQGLNNLHEQIDEMLHSDRLSKTGEHRAVLESYRLFSKDKGWIKRIRESIESGLAVEAAVEREQSSIRARMQRIKDSYLRDRLSDIDDLSNRLLRILTGRQTHDNKNIPSDAILIARNIGPAELLDYGDKLKGVVLEEGSVGSHATIVARALSIPLFIQAEKITREALEGDEILLDSDTHMVHLRPEDTVKQAFTDKAAMMAKAQEAYSSLRDKPAKTQDGTHIKLTMNAGLMADLPSLNRSGAEGVGLYRTELHFLIRPTVPKRSELAALYKRVLDAAGDKPVNFRTLDIGSDKVLAYMKPQEEPNPALGWRGIRLALDRPGVMKMQLQALIRAAAGKNLRVMFPMVSQLSEFQRARDYVFDVLETEKHLGHLIPNKLSIGVMMETPSLAFSPDKLYQSADFISIGGNDLKQFFFAADRENERVRTRYDSLNTSFLNLIEHIVKRCAEHGTELSFCGEDAGRPLEALCFTAVGIRALSMRPSSIGPVKHLLRSVDLNEAKAVIDASRNTGAETVREDMQNWLKSLKLEIIPR